MKKATFMAFCPFEIGDACKIVFDMELKIFSKDNFIVDDILAIHSVKTGTVKFEIILRDEYGRIVKSLGVNDVVLISDL